MKKEERIKELLETKARFEKSAEGCPSYLKKYFLKRAGCHGRAVKIVKSLPFPAWTKVLV